MDGTPGGLGPIPPDAGASADGPPPPETRPRNSRILLWIILGVIAFFVVAVVAVVALLIPVRTETDGSPTPSVSTDLVPTTTSPSTTGTSEPGGPTSTSAPTSSTGQWVELPTPDLTAPADAVAVSDEALVVNTGDDGLYASMIGEGEVGQPIKLPTSAHSGTPTIDGTLVAWWEGSHEETTNVFIDQVIYAMRLPDGPRVKVVDSDRSPYYPQLSGDSLTWVRPQPENGDAHAAYWVQSIYRVTVGDDGSPQGEPTLLTDEPRAYVLGAGAAWAYSFDGSLLAWEQHKGADELGSGVYLTDITAGETTQLSQTGGRPSVAGTIVTYFGEALEAYDVTDKKTWTIDPRGDWAASSEDFVVYRRGVRRQTYREIVARRFDDDSEQVLARLEAHPLVAAPLAASANHIAFVGDDGRVKLFEWRAGS